MDAGILATTIVIFILFILLAILTIARCLVMINRYGYRRRTVQVDTHLLLATFALARVVDSCFRFFVPSSPPLDAFLFATNRLAMLIQLTAFHIVLVYWIETVRTTVSSHFATEAATGALKTGSDGFIMGSFGPLRIGSFLIYIFTLACIIFYWIEGKEGIVGTVVYDINIIVLALLFLVTSVGFGTFGSRLRTRIARLTKQRASMWWANRDLRNVSLITWFSSVCFLVRCVITTWYIISPDFLTNQLFVLWMAGEYVIPEILPTLALLFAFAQPVEDDAATSYYLVPPWQQGPAPLANDSNEPKTKALIGEDALRMDV